MNIFVGLAWCLSRTANVVLVIAATVTMVVWHRVGLLVLSIYGSNSSSFVGAGHLWNMSSIFALDVVVLRVCRRQQQALLHLLGRTIYVNFVSIPSIIYVSVIRVTVATVVGWLGF